MPSSTSIPYPADEPDPVAAAEDQADAAAVAEARKEDGAIAWDQVKADLGLDSPPADEPGTVDYVPAEAAPAPAVEPEPAVDIAPIEPTEPAV